MKTKQLPVGWEEIELGDENCFEILSSGIKKFKGIKNYLSTESIKGTVINKIECEISFKERPSRANMQPVLNSIWFAKMQATLKVYCFDETNKDEIEKYILSTGFAGIRINEEKVYPKYIKLILASKFFNKEKDDLCTGSTQKGINNAFIKKIKVPLPLLSVQKKIVEVLERAEGLKRRREEADGLMDDYLKSVFSEMFLGERFPEEELENVTKIIMGQSPPGDSYNENENGMPFFQGKREFGDKYPVVEKWTTTPSKIAEPDSILMSVRAPVGDINLCPIKSCIGRGLASIVPMEKLELGYLYSFLKLNKEKISDLGSGSTFKAITGKQLKAIKIQVPPIAIQKKFASIVERVEKIKEAQGKSGKEIGDLFGVLMQRAFRGEIE